MNVLRRSTASKQVRYEGYASDDQVGMHQFSGNVKRDPGGRLNGQQNKEENQKNEVSKHCPTS